MIIEDILRDKFVSSIHDIAYEARNKTRAVDEMRVQYNNALNFYGSTGIFFLPYDVLFNITRTFDTSPIDIFKQIARRDGRVFIVAISDAYNYNGEYEHSFGGPVTSLIVRKLKAVRLLVAPLNQIAHSVEGGRVKLAGYTVMVSPAPGMWRYHFKGDEGLSFLQEFFKSCTTHPTSRMILKLRDKR